jgi:hypothetical protein
VAEGRRLKMPVPQVLRPSEDRAVLPLGLVDVSQRREGVGSIPQVAQARRLVPGQLRQLATDQGALPKGTDLVQEVVQPPGEPPLEPSALDSVQQVRDVRNPLGAPRGPCPADELPAQVLRLLSRGLAARPGVQVDQAMNGAVADSVPEEQAQTDQRAQGRGTPEQVPGKRRRDVGI